jgi:hypothetical protein
MSKNAKDLNSMSLSQLTVEYNRHASKKITKFSCSKAAAVAKVLAVQPKKTTSTSKLGIGKMTVALLKDGGKPADVLAALRKHFKADVSSMSSVYWYSSKLKTGDIE